MSSKIAKKIFKAYRVFNLSRDAGEHHRMEHGLFDDDYADNSFDRNLPALFDETDIQDNERFLFSLNFNRD